MKNIVIQPIPVPYYITSSDMNKNGKFSFLEF